MRCEKEENSSMMDAVVTLEDPKIMNDEVFTISSHINCTYTIEVKPHVESVIIACLLVCWWKIWSVEVSVV